MSDENKYAIVKNLYDKGNYILALRQLETYATVDGFANEDFAWAGWCNFRLGNLAEAVEVLHRVTDNNQRALLCKAYVLADCRYESVSKTEVHETLARISDFVVIARAFIDFARDPNNVFWRDNNTMLAHVSVLAPDEGVEVGHLFRDASRVCADNATTSADFFIALGLLEIAIMKYGIADENAHHRAEALFWKSKVMEVVGDVPSAYQVANKSAKLWLIAIQHDPQNEGYRDCRVGVIGHALRLERLVQQATK
jgi:tetratricopeptide (TPR) repeat protein